MKNKLIFGLLILLLIPIATADVSIQQTIVTNESVVSEHNIFSEGNVDLIINGVDVEGFDSLQFNTLSTYISENENIWEDDDVGIKDKDVYIVLRNAISFIFNPKLEMYKDYEINLGYLLINTFMLREEIDAKLEKINTRIDFIERYIQIKDEYNGTDKEIYEYAKYLVLKEKGYSSYEDFEGDTWHIDQTWHEPIHVYDVTEPEEEQVTPKIPNECNGMFYSLAKNIALAQCRTEETWQFTDEISCYNDQWVLGIKFDEVNCNPACIVDTINKTAEIELRCGGGGASY